MTNYYKYITATYKNVPIHLNEVLEKVIFPVRFFYT